MRLKNKRILITAGPTWVAIDKVRAITNIATGQTGILLAEELIKRGSQVTLLLGPVGASYLNKRIKVIRFNYFEKFKRKFITLLKSKEYDAVIHSAAVSDYMPKAFVNKKIESGRKQWLLKLVPTAKIINLIKKVDKSLFLVGFKFEAGAPKNILIKYAKRLMQESHLDLAVANTTINNNYLSYILSKNKIYGPFRNKKILTGQLINILSLI
jgi:phosphopantothenoylcysteine decarboxylase/phosphopantothenate--cysteine ligase